MAGCGLENGVYIALKLVAYAFVCIGARALGEKYTTDSGRLSSTVLFASQVVALVSKNLLHLYNG